MAYDRKLGGWRGPVGASRWRAGAGDELGRAAGTDGAAAGHAAGLEARRGAGDDRQRGDGSAGSMRPGQTPQPRTGALPLSDIAWARPLRDGKPGPAPRRMTDVMQQGDVVMVEPNATRADHAACEERQAGACTAAAPGAAADSRRCRARWCRSIPPPAACSPWSAAGASRAASSTAPRRRSASLAPASSRSSI